MLSLTKYESNLIVHGYCSHSCYNRWRETGWLNMKICQRWQRFFLHLWQNKLILVELKTNRGVMFITILLHFHYFISLEKANVQKSEVFLLRISLGNVNASVVICRYPQIYNISFWEEFLETLCMCIYLVFEPQISEHLLWRTVPLAVSRPCNILVNNT